MRKGFFALALLFFVLAGLNVAGHLYRYELHAWAVEFESQRANLSKHYLDVAGQRVAYLEGPQQAGQSTVIMLHGFSAGKENWLRYAAHLTEYYHVLIPDLAGHGENSGDLNGDYSASAQLAFLHNFMAAKQVKQAHLVGNSMGGGIAALYAADYPQEVQSIILVSPAGVHEIPSELDEAVAQGENRLIVSDNWTMDDVLGFVMEQPPYIPGPILEVEAERSIARFALNQHIFKQLKGEFEGAIHQKLSQVRVPALIIWGAEDRAIHVQNIEKYASLVQGAKKYVLDDVGHMAMIELPEVTANASKAFWAAL